MKLKRIKNKESEEYKESLEIYLEAFPPEERREKIQQSRLLRNKNYCFYSILDKSKVIGILGIWRFKSFIFIEHIAVNKKIRSKGYGRIVLKKIFSSTKKIIVGEVEKPGMSKMADRRINFFKSLGLKVNNYKYIQPPYDKTKKPVELLIVTYPRLITKREFENIRDKIHLQAYKIKNPLR